MPGLNTPTAQRILELMVPVRESLEEAIFATQSPPLSSLTNLLSSVSTELCDQLGEIWTEFSSSAPEQEISRHFSQEDRLLLDLILSLSDDRRVYSCSAGPYRGI